jgi:hypothetical protein
MLAEYLALIRPLEIFLSHKFNYKGADDLNEFLWADYKKGRWDGEFLSDLLKITTSEHKMQALGFRDYRQVALAFMEKHLKYKVKDIKGLNAILDLQAGHTSRTAAVDYAVSTEDHGNVSREAMHQYYLASGEWSQLLMSFGVQGQVQRGPEISQDSRMQEVIEMVHQSSGSAGDMLLDQNTSEEDILISRRQNTMTYDQRGISI